MNPAATPARSPLDALVLCLEAEYRALLAEDAQQLEAVLAQKQQLLARLAETAGAAMGQPQGEPPRSGAPLRRALARLRELNARNASVLAPRAARDRARLQFLQSALGRPALYGADGSVRAQPYPSPTGS